MDLWYVHVFQALVTSLLIVVAVNVASLVYARTATRHGEIAVRSALGASRRRIVAQLFVEAFVLSALAAGLGLLFTEAALSYVSRVIGLLGDVPFWLDFDLSWNLALYITGLAVLGAVIVGVLPAMQATGCRVQARLRDLGGGTGMQLGRTWTALIVAQVAFAVAALPVAVSSGWQLIQLGTAEHPFAADEFLTARLVMDQETPSSARAEAYRREFAARYGARLVELTDRLEADPRVAGVTFTSHFPTDEAPAVIDVDGVRTESRSGHDIRVGRVDLNFFETFDVPLVAGRSFGSGDQDDGATSVVVNQAFVQTVLGGVNPLGRRVRYVRYRRETGDAEFDLDMERWYEIVGVVGNFPARHVEPLQVEAKLYHAIAADRLYPARLSMRIRGADATTFAGRLYEMTTTLDPALLLQEVQSLGDVYDEEQSAMRRGALLISMVMGSVLLLSTAGLYTLMAFTVVQRRREIGIRLALGADAARILGGVFSRALRQLAVGIAIGVAIAAGLSRLSGGALLFGGRAAVLLPVAAALMLAVGLLAAIGPARRGLRIEPSEALKAEG
ncbi:MAG: FtsX-like permease family protein [Acidobacteria bacterium]|nr:FtsX-like permease family protein [Acidobacteriota bacterium]